jgi:arginyl-tRNA synthetase
MNLEKKIIQGIKKGFLVLFNAELNEAEISLQPTKKEFEGTYTFVTFSFARLTKKNPEESGRLLGEFLKAELKEVSDFNVVKGFLNLVISDQAWLDLFRTEIVSPGFALFPEKKEKVLVEYSSPNTNKPLHLGHLRNNFLGFSISEILKEAGYKVFKVNLINDRGIHICKSMLAYLKWGNNETPQSAGMKGDHLIGKYYVLFDKEYKKQVDALLSEGMVKEEAEKRAPVILEAQEMLRKWEEGNKEIRALWEKMNEWVYEGFEATYKTIGVNFDKYYYESDTYLLGKQIVEEGLKKNIFFKKEDGSVWVDLSSEGLDQKLLLRSDGTSVYITQDLGTADLKYQDFQAEKSIYVVGNEQDYHFNVLRLILKKLGRSYAEGVYHLSYGMVDLPSGRMKSREGTVVDADDLIEEVVSAAEKETREKGKIEEFTEEEAKKLFRKLGLGALKYFLLKVDPKKRMLFNPEESIDLHGNTGPFIQYTHARISAILRRAKQMGIDTPVEKYKNLNKLHPSEKDVLTLLSEFPKKISEAAGTYSPAIIAQYIFELAKEYNRFYAEVSIFNEEDKEAMTFRIAFSETVAKAIKRGMNMLGVEVPERM